MPRLVALDLAGGPAFVTALQRIWDAGDAILPIDQRLSRESVVALTTDMGASLVVDAEGSRRLAGGRPTDDGDAIVVVTSGSTGMAKGVVLTHDAVRASALATSRRLGIEGDDHWLACLPLNHVAGLSVVTRALRTGTSLTVLPGFQPGAVIAAARQGATSTSLVATALKRIDPAIFRRIVLGGARAPEVLPGNAVTTYGLTETGSGVVYDGVPLDGVEVQIAHDGEILVRGPMLLRSYRDGTTPVDGDGWLHTDDVGRWLDDGRLHVVGRRGDMIVTGGENVWPDVVEAAMASHPGVVEVGVAGLHDPEWGEAVTAWIVPADASHPPALDEIRAWVERRLPRFMAPRSLVLVERLPRTSIGKLQRSRLLPRGEPDSQRDLNP